MTRRYHYKTPLLPCEYSDADLIDYAHSCANAVSYYNAAEGNWSSETEPRDKAKDEFHKVMRELCSRGLEIDLRGYLL